jgi:hypothetical protein
MRADAAKYRFISRGVVLPLSPFGTLLPMQVQPLFASPQLWKFHKLFHFCCKTNAVNTLWRDKEATRQVPVPGKLACSDLFKPSDVPRSSGFCSGKFCALEARSQKRGDCGQVPLISAIIHHDSRPCRTARDWHNEGLPKSKGNAITRTWQGRVETI